MRLKRSKLTERQTNELMKLSDNQGNAQQLAENPETLLVFPRSAPKAMFSITRNSLWLFRLLFLFGMIAVRTIGLRHRSHFILHSTHVVRRHLSSHCHWHHAESTEEGVCEESYSNSDFHAHVTKVYAQVLL